MDILIAYWIQIENIIIPKSLVILTMYSYTLKKKKTELLFGKQVNKCDICTW